MSLSKLVDEIKDLLDFEKRIWVVNIYGSGVMENTFIINEDSFNERLEWMVKRGYSDNLLHRVDKLSRSQVIEFSTGTENHRLMRIK
ncbi:hypothetical protein L0B53_16330 [Vibrio sp. SS-MA-C1-2]|uniref:hypothetical protein n=1 Tax=Vibrio sp. SS-MA-C1-2 TaxID=2908646 RepID=UPI001F1A7824|nr:hypothetical protein [Vibrio sp. SS-MA-C1-2]UJF18560.1 hypothetical protein L0B53_16330 [Vibrio sp. SS-MA-C1-2]